MPPQAPVRPILTYGNVRLLNVPGAEPCAEEVFTEDSYTFAEIPEGAMVLDGGAFYGEFALRCAVERGATVIAYEPHHSSADVLRANVALNHVRGRVEVRERALGRLTGEARFVEL